MSTTFAVVMKSGEPVDVARRSGGEMWFINMFAAEMLPDDTNVIPTDNTAQGIYTIGDIRAAIGKQLAAEEDNEAWIDTKKIEVKPRNSAFVTMTDAWHKPHDYVEVTDWTIAV